jgi:hypothetical protein
VSLVRVFSPDTEAELATIVELLEAREVPCFVGSARLAARSSATILVPAERLAEALELIGQLLGSCAAYGGVARDRPSDRFRARLRRLWFGR